MSIYGYVRISTAKQSIDRQIRNIKQAFPAATIIQETFTGTTFQRKEWHRLIKTVKRDNTIIFDSVSRMSRTADEGFTVYESLFNQGIRLVFLKEPHINTDTYRNALSQSIPMTNTSVDLILSGINQYSMALAKQQIKLAFEQAEKEVLDLRQRTCEGIQTARLQGKQIGQRQGAKLTTRKSITAKQVIMKHSRDFGGSLSDIEVMKLAGLSRNTYYKYKRELKQSK